MAAFLKKLSKIDERTKYGVYGWMRQAEKELQLGYIPLMIQSICLLYFYEEQMFDIIGKDIKVSKNKKCITKINECGWTNNSYGITEIESNTFYGIPLMIHRM